MNADPNPYPHDPVPDQDKTARSMNPRPVFVLLPLFRTTILAKFVVNFVLNEDMQKNKDMIQFDVTLFSVWVRV